MTNKTFSQGWIGSRSGDAEIDNGLVAFYENLLPDGETEPSIADFATSRIGAIYGATNVQVNVMRFRVAGTTQTGNAHKIQLPLPKLNITATTRCQQQDAEVIKLAANRSVPIWLVFHNTVSKPIFNNSYEDRNIINGKVVEGGGLGTYGAVYSFPLYHEPQAVETEAERFTNFANWSAVYGNVTGYSIRPSASPKNIHANIFDCSFNFIATWSADRVKQPL